MRHIILAAAIVGLAIGCNQPAQSSAPPPPLPTPAQVDISGAYDLTLTERSIRNSKGALTSWCSGYTFEGLKMHDYECSSDQKDRALLLVPTRLFLTDNKNHTITIDSRKECTGKLFDKDIFADCEDKSDDFESTVVQYQLSVKDGILQGMMRYIYHWHNMNKTNNFSLAQDYTVSGSRAVVGQYHYYGR
jgi:hypothetical protein